MQNLSHKEWIMLLQGAWTTLWVCLLAIACGVIVGLIIALIRNARIPVLSRVLALYVSISRATPLVTLMLFVFLGFPAFGIELNKYVAAVVALILNTAAFNAEIWRNAFQTFSRDQLDAAKAAGMTPLLAFRRIMLPQMLLTSLPGLINEMTFLIKASPAMGVIGMVDLTRQTNRISAVTYQPLPPILVACVFYMVMIAFLLWAQRASERYIHRLT